jgi:hypothetical protein
MQILQFSQIVVYGANGWLGRSTVEAILTTLPEFVPEKLLLIGSKSGELEILGKKFEILDPKVGELRIKKGAIFFNCAFLRREFINKLGEQEFTTRNLEIMALPTRSIGEMGLFSFVNLSSGAAALVDQNPENSIVDAYSVLKRRSELEFEEKSITAGSNFINCRIYSISGCHLNEFKNLALSSFISRALKSQEIHVSSPLSKRTYVNSVNLMAVILRLAIQGESKNFDSGGTLISMLGLAETIKKVAGQTELKVSVGTDPEVSYFGDYESFNDIAAGINQNLLNIENQIINTIKAFD